jgi:fatty-acyl-CoA synthase
MTQSFADLSPISFLLRAAGVFPERVAVRHDERTFTYAEHLARASALAGVLQSRGVGPGDRVAVLLPNVPEMLEAHYAVPGMGAALVPMNTRLSAPEIGRILAHSGATVLITDAAGTELAAAAELGREGPEVITTGADYDGALAAAAPVDLTPQPENQLLSINYTSGTTGAPKGVMYTHRGAFLQSLGMIAETRMSPRSRYLWTLPMFHCHGWSFTWAVTAVGAEHLCLPQVTGAAAWRLIGEHRVTHLCGAPTVLGTLLDADSAQPAETDEPVRVYTGGAPPSPATIQRCEALGWDVTHLYGLTETYGPIGVCVWHPEWDELEAAQRARLKARQGVVSVVSQPLRVIDRDGDDVPMDAETMGEIVMRGNNVTIGYYRDDEQTAEAMAGGYFHSGDVGVMHPDGYVEIRDRIKDIIISGGENISSIEVEQALAEHPAVAQVAVVGVPHERWGETPHAFVVVRPGSAVEPSELRDFARGRLAGYKLPSIITLADELPTTATGKVQKMHLRELATAPARPA